MPALRDDFAELADVLKSAVLPAFTLLGGYLQAIGERMNFFGTIVGGILTKLMPFSGKSGGFGIRQREACRTMGLGPDSPMTRGDFKQPRVTRVLQPKKLLTNAPACCRRPRLKPRALFKLGGGCRPESFRSKRLPSAKPRMKLAKVKN